MTDETSDTVPHQGGSPDGGDAGFDIPGLDDLQMEELTPEQETQIAEAQAAMEDARARLSEVPADVVVTNHVMGLYELAAIHLSAPQPDFVQAALAIDAVGCLVEGLGDRLGEEAPTMRDALNNIRMAFVQLQGGAGAPPATPSA